ncbi:Diaminobutyrate--2-oxoglutarate transaminase [Rubripirellula obstinata]|uniref:Diaminobutyrate--2-oxoglutarate transaminase n=1 Tax=Rubripirellula obstinata TaxID=406547 RepID=A0A5B1CR65_9BACT|nr:diaminobutyrate--2-oxoglutarate transaminase [Rubripirellula obstinata]KAA1261873.1 Diaminobutyrate--2-oxoglutarate transaminase [Rubripirellula obstinata]
MTDTNDAKATDSNLRTSGDPLERIESGVRGYAKLFPAVFDRAVGSTLTSEDGRQWIDFFCGAGSLNYGHNNPAAKQALLDYISRDGIQHSLDTVTAAKVEFVETFEELILRPRGLDYRIQFTGPTGTNAVEAAIKLAKQKTSRSHVIAFTNAYHGHSLGSLALTGNRFYHSEFYGSRNNVTHLPYDGYSVGVDSARLLAKMLEDSSSGIPIPAAIILETVQGEGGVNVASDQWLCEIASICRHHGIVLVIDDIQVGNGRTGKFFSFEHAGIKPDVVCLSKSIGGGLPMSIVLIDPEMDVWKPGQHTGTFRGNNLAFVAAAAVLKNWADPNFESEIQNRSEVIQTKLSSIQDRYSHHEFDVRGRGMIWGLDVADGTLARTVIDDCFANGLLMEASGAEDQVLKIMPALTIPTALLKHGLDIFGQAIDRAIDRAINNNADAKDSSTSNASPAMPSLEWPADVTGIPMPGSMTSQ